MTHEKGLIPVIEIEKLIQFDFFKRCSYSPNMLLTHESKGATDIVTLIGSMIKESLFLRAKLPIVFTMSLAQHKAFLKEGILSYHISMKSGLYGFFHKKLFGSCAKEVSNIIHQHRNVVPNGGAVYVFIGMMDADAELTSFIESFFSQQSNSTSECWMVLRNESGLKDGLFDFGRTLRSYVDNPESPEHRIEISLDNADEDISLEASFRGGLLPLKADVPALPRD